MLFVCLFGFEGGYLSDDDDVGSDDCLEYWWFK
jgi:hypothetical protein